MALTADTLLLFGASGDLAQRMLLPSLFALHADRLLPPDLAAVCGAAGELFFPVLLILGLFGRFSALGLQAVNLLAVISYAHVLFKEGYEAAIGQHYLWSFMLLMLIVYGPGKWSVDGWAQARSAR